MRLIVYLFIILFFASCSDNKIEPYVTYLNHNDTVSYVGINQCMQCHYDIYQTYIQTGMGQSFSLANPTNSDANFESFHSLKDTFSNYNYHVGWNDTTLIITEQWRDLHQRQEIADFIIGSGHHTNSHLWEESGYVHQLPFTYYTQDSTLDFPPGYENGFNSRFSRKIGLECMSCHNAMPEFVLGSENKYDKIPRGIDCERCHGPGEVHVHRMTSGQLVDTSQHIDYSIVNPKRLSLEAQFQICMRCHLQGNTILTEGKSFKDFKPGMKLSDVMTVFVPKYEGDESFIMASHVDRLKQSSCFNASEMNCTTCHDPHHSVKKKAPDFFNNKCLSCHEDCTIPEGKGMDCVSCHMPSSSTIDIPHVSIHDHKIGVHFSDSLMSKGAFIGLKSINNNNPSKKVRAKAFLYQYEKFDAQAFYLDSAQQLLKHPINEIYHELIHLYFLKKDYISVLNVSQAISSIIDSLNIQSYENRDAWTAYRIAQAYKSQGDDDLSLHFFEKATDLAPYVLDFQQKLADHLLAIKQIDKAEERYQWLLKEFPKNAVVWCNLGYLYAFQGKYEIAQDHYQNALKLDPQHIQSLFNLASLKIMLGNIEQGLVYLKRIVELEPQNQQAKELLQNIDAKKD